MEKKIKKTATAKVAVAKVLETSTAGSGFLYKFQLSGNKLSTKEQKATRGKIRAKLSTLVGAYLVAERMKNLSGVDSAIAELRTFVRSTYTGEMLSPATFQQMDAEKRVYYTSVVNSLAKRKVDFVRV